MLSPQPARPRRQMPETLPGWFTFAAAAWTCVQVGCSGRVTPAALSRDLL